MSGRQAQVEQLATLIMESPALPELRERVQRGLFDRFRGATHDEREIINAIMDNEALFFKELTLIYNKAIEEKDVNDEEEKEKPKEED